MRIATPTPARRQASGPFIILVTVMCVGAVGCGSAVADSRETRTSATESHATEQCGLATPALRELARRAGKSIGTAFRSTYVSDDPCYGSVSRREFDSVTTEIGTMTNTVAPDPGRYDFREADATAAEAIRAKQSFDIHALVWDPLDQQQWGIVPAYVRQMKPGERQRFMTDLVTAVVSRYATRARSATVVNEPFDQRGNLQHNAWWQTTGNDNYIVDAFRAARRASPTMKLYLNEHSSETMSDKSNALYALARKLRNTTTMVRIDGRDVRKPLLDGVGFQAHLLGGKDQQPSTDDMRENLERFAALGLNIRFTEMDVRVPTANGRSTSADLNRQAQVYATIARLCRDIPRCSGITLWGFTDKRSWITDYPSSFSGYGNATPLDTRYAPKPAWASLREVFAP